MGIPVSSEWYFHTSQGGGAMLLFTKIPASAGIDYFAGKVIPGGKGGKLAGRASGGGNDVGGEKPDGRGGKPCEEGAKLTGGKLDGSGAEPVITTVVVSGM